MDVRAVGGDATRARVDALVLPMFSTARVPAGVADGIDRALDGAIARLAAAGEIKGKKGDVTVVHTLGKMPPKRVLLLGLGSARAFTTDIIRSAMGEAARVLRGIGAQRIAVVLPDNPGAGASGDASRLAQATVEGAVLGLYQFAKYKKNGSGGPAVREMAIIERARSRLEGVRAGIYAGTIIADSVCLARDMANEPANQMTPAAMAGVASDVARASNLDVSILERDEMERLGMGALLGVARGSAEPPRLIVLRYWGDPEHRERVIGLVGKGVTFDSGGISLKTAAGMAHMKTDMAGGACVIAAMRAIGLLAPKVNVTALVPAAENMPSGTAQKPGDVVTALNGKTIEIANTDAEGRLLLADALAYARQQGLSPLIDVATLTGAMTTTFGDACSGAFGNHQPTLNRLLRSARAVGERVWQMPMYEEYRELIRSDVADMKNTGGQAAGSIAAAWFLAEFSGSTPWVHLDIAGTARKDSTKGHTPRGATGVMVRTLVQLVLDTARSR